MTIGERIKKIRKDKGMSPEKLAELIGKDRATIYRYESNDIEKLPTNVLEPLCKALGTTPAYIMGWTEELGNNFIDYSKADLVEAPKKKKEKFLIPVLGTVRAGYPAEAIENILDYEEISESMARNGEYFALKVKGDSMLPRFTEGDIVIVRKQNDVDNGDIAIMLVNGDEATIKKVQKFKGGINLIPSNTTYDVITYSNKDIATMPVQCLGKVVELRAKF